MITFQYLQAPLIESVIPLYKYMISENIQNDIRLRDYDFSKTDFIELLSFSLNQNDDIFLLVYVDEKLIGFIDSTKIVSKNIEWFIKSIYFLPDYRNEQLFQSTLKYLENIIKKKGIITIKNNALINDTVANGIWKKCGYNVVGSIRMKQLV